jgi:hypothetical protein
MFKLNQAFHFEIQHNKIDLSNIIYICNDSISKKYMKTNKNKTMIIISQVVNEFVRNILVNKF